MPKISNSKTASFSAEKIFGIVIDVESYPRHLDFIQRIDILEKSDALIKARVFVGLPVLTFSYDCLIEYKEPEYVKVRLISGPFKKLYAEWFFNPLSDDSCEIHYALDSEFKNPIMEMTAGAIFAKQLNQSIKAFLDALKRS
jgi:ribosome-associated toxin RatA of RatAB toxin-antitoxin module